MARRLSKTQTSELTIHDHLSDTEIVLSYRMPTTQEREGYANASVRRTRKGMKFEVVKARQEFGLKILTGIREGDFEAEKADGTFNLLASDPSSPNYREDWKTLVAELAPDLVQALAGHVFDASAEIIGDEAEGN